MGTTKERSKQPFYILHKIAMQKAREIQREKIEKLFSIDEYGDCYYIEGDYTLVTPSEVMLIRGVIDVHNHPNKKEIPFSFSGEDVAILLDYPWKKEIIVSGYGVYFWMRRGNCVKDGETVCNELNDIYRDLLKKELMKLPPNLSKKAIRARVKALDPILSKKYHKELCTYAEKIGLSYGKVKL